MVEAVAAVAEAAVVMAAAVVAMAAVVVVEAATVAAAGEAVAGIVEIAETAGKNALPDAKKRRLDPRNAAPNLPEDSSKVALRLRGSLSFATFQPKVRLSLRRHSSAKKPLVRAASRSRRARAVQLNFSTGESLPQGIVSAALQGLPCIVRNISSGNVFETIGKENDGWRRNVKYVERLAACLF